MSLFLDKLALFDPDLARTVAENSDDMSPKAMERLVEDTLWASSMEPSFGHAVAEGYLALGGNVGPGETAEYHRLVRDAGERGPVFGRLMAVHLVPVLRSREGCLTAPFLEAVDIMQTKGTYTLPGPLETLSTLLSNRENAAACAYLELLCAAFALELSYVRCQHFAYVLPRAVLAFAPQRRAWQTAQLCRVIRTDPILADPFLEGMTTGLHLLSEASLDEFVFLGLKKFSGNRKQGMKHFSLSSRAGLDFFRQLQVTVSLREVRPRLNRYIQARIGAGVAVQSQSSLPVVFLKEPIFGALAVSDGKYIYLPEEISRFSTRPENISLYKTLVRLEGSHFEFGTFHFDLEKMAAGGETEPMPKPMQGTSDLERFFGAFPIPELAEDLFTIFEHGRIRKCLDQAYPGLIRRCLPLLQAEARRISQNRDEVDPVQALYNLAALGMAAADFLMAVPGDLQPVLKRVLGQFDTRILPNAAVEACGRLVAEAYPALARILSKRGPLAQIAGSYRPMVTPFGRRVTPELIFSRQQAYDRPTWKIKSWIEKKGYRVYASEIRRRLIDGDGKISMMEIRRAIRPGSQDPHPRSDDNSIEQHPIELNLSELNNDLFAGIQVVDDNEPDDALGYPVFRYDEWDSGAGDYMKDHVRVCLRPVPEEPNDFYPVALSRYPGLVKQMRYAFELLKPQEMKILRRWVDGDEFDYRALLNVAIDKKAGLIPSDRLYNKRVKQKRDVSVLLLVDMSRSTANRVQGATATVLDVEKEAIVLLCEALLVVGDDFSIAGFSGTGRLGVDYYSVKKFEETMDDTIRGRLNALSPQRSTRMGAAIRHATRQLEETPSRVRLLIILGDGFPNDLDYKQGYAVADTRRAISEARSRDVFTHAITVNIAGDPHLDELYGNVRHTVISDVRELPDKLLRIYGALTRY